MIRHYLGGDGGWGPQSDNEGDQMWRMVALDKLTQQCSLLKLYLTSMCTDGPKKRVGTWMKFDQAKNLCQ